jgi:acyl carrier protein phosphodiesterase
MNWLAHLLLSEPTPAFRVGGILPDLVSSAVLEGLPVEFQRGILRHRQVDAFTDAHPAFRRSVERFQPPLRRFGGVLVDIFYDHFLSRNWYIYSDIPLPVFVAECYAAFEETRADLPPEAYAHLQRIRAGDWLGSYGEIAGIAHTLQRISTRMRRPIDLTPAVAVLESDYDSFHADFMAFFPTIKEHLHGSL